MSKVINSVKVPKKGKSKARPISALTSGARRTIPRAERRRNAKSDRKATSGIVRPGDERLAKESVSTLIAPSTKSTISHVITPPGQSLFGPVIAWVTAAAQRGYYDNTSNPSFLYWAYVYATKVLAQAANGAPILAQQVPHWMLCLCDALRPKNVKMDQGEVSYRISVDSSSAPPPMVSVGSIAYGYEWLCFQAGPAGAGGFPTAVAPLPYTSDANGVIAFNDVSTFMMTAYEKTSASAANQLVPYVTVGKGKWAGDASCFGFVTNQEGFGFNRVGGIAQVINHQVNIKTPMFTVFGQDTTTTAAFDGFRYPVFTCVGAGDGITAGNNMVQAQPERHWRAKRKPLIHSIDFLQFGDVLARYVSKLQAQRFSDVGSSSILDPLTYVCPLTLQEMLLVLRNEMMYVFGQTQTGYQSILPRAVANVSDNEWTPYLAMPSTVALSGTGMKLPLIFVENVKSLLSRVTMYHGDKDPQYFIGVLGQYNSDTLSTTAYTFEHVDFNNPPVITPSFRVQAAREIRIRDSRGAESWVGAPEVPISLVDGSTSADYLFINNPTDLQRLTSLWNDWLSQLAQYSSPLTTLSRDLGANVACGVATTRHWVTLVNGGNGAERSSNSRDVRFMKPKYTDSPYLVRQVAATTLHAAPLAGPWEQIVSQFVLPINHLSGSGPSDTTTFTRMQDMMKEPYSVAGSASGDDGELLVTILDSLASKMVHGRDAPLNDLDQFFVDATKDGHAGLLSSLAANFLGKAFGPTAGAIASAVADVLPI